MASVNISIVRDNGTSVQINGPVDDTLFAGISQSLADQVAAAVSAITTHAPAPEPGTAAAPAEPVPAPAPADAAPSPDPVAAPA